ncbi:MAG: cytochrome c-type biogenesis protein CcmH [Gammaproteobacteria bacterium]|nr:cytochrome c-type biogenesis protein CcmH [Gammaproteobacteria bacterium]
MLFCLLLLAGAPASASDAPAEFSNPALAARYDVLLGELRCLVCQNQTLKDSHAELAQDLRDEVKRLLEKGDSDAAIRDYLVARYGDFVLYSPPLKESTWLLWLGPFVLLALAVMVVVMMSRRRAPPPAPLDDTERARLAQALAERREHP